jgi:hypothetical protein
MNSSFSRRTLPWIALALAAVAFTAPAAEARHAPSENAKATPTPASVSAPSSNFEVDRLGPKHVALHRPQAAAPVSVVKVVRPGGFDWADAGIGAGVAGLALALAAALAMLVTRRSRGTALPDQSELASA